MSSAREAAVAASRGLGTALDELRAEVPGVHTSAERCASARTDQSGWQPAGRPAAVVAARGVQDVQATLRWASAHRVAIVPRGAGTGLAGGASAGDGTVVLDLTGLDRILEIRPEDGLAVVEAGVVTAVVDRAARCHGLRYVPDPGSVEQSTIGGNIATNAGGLHCVKYGVTRESVLGLDVVLADGSRIRTGADTVKGVTGYDLTGLFVGSEGTLGVVVGATLRLHPLPRSVAGAVAAFASVEAAAEAAIAVTAAGIAPSVLELLDGATLAQIDEVNGTDLRRRGEALLVIETDGFGAVEAAEAALAVLGRTAVEARAGEGTELDDILAARRLALPAVQQLGTALIEDIAVPRSALARAVREISAISRRTGVPVFTFAHAGDGNLHPIVLAGPGGTITPEVQRTADAIFELALDLGGTITGEHGVGVLKRRWVARELDTESHGLHLRLRELLDPRGILNPGKAL